MPLKGLIKDEAYKNVNFRAINVVNIVGASVSCLALLISIFILLSLRKIRSTRNYIHCNLFMAIIVNTMFKTLLFVQGLLKKQHSDSLCIQLCIFDFIFQWNFLKCIQYNNIYLSDRLVTIQSEMHFPQACLNRRF